MKHRRELIKNEIIKMRRPVELRQPELEEMRALLLLDGVVACDIADIPLVIHQAQYALKTVGRARKIHGWIVERGIAGQRGEHSRLRKIKLRGGGMPRLILQAKVDTGGSINTIGQMPIVDSIEVHRQNIFFG